MNALFEEADCLEAVETSAPIKVGRPESDVVALKAEFGRVMVNKAFAAWNILVTQVTYIPNQIIAAGSPREVCSIFRDQTIAAGSPSEGWSSKLTIPHSGYLLKLSGSWKLTIPHCFVYHNPPKLLT